jgi:hypothetical protein
MKEEGGGSYMKLREGKGLAQMARKKLHKNIREYWKKVTANKINDICIKIGQYLIKCKKKWERIVRKSDEGDEERERDDETKCIIQ